MTSAADDDIEWFWIENHKLKGAKAIYFDIILLSYTEGLEQFIKNSLVIYLA